jgi:LCP family protein required for cell wall assembly
MNATGRRPFWYALTCAAAAVMMVAAGYAHHFVNEVTSIGGGVTITAGHSSTGAMNVLVMGLESRTDYQGNPLDHHLQVVLHSGSQGGQATNTLILLHVFAGGQRAVGFSIPRDDWVTFPQPYDGQTAGKIDQAYGFAYAQSLNDTVNSGQSSQARYLAANRAGQAATIATVEAVTGQRVDHFAEVNLAGYYYLAQAFGGITVCVKPWTAGGNKNLADANSGWDAVASGYDVAKGGSQYLHLSPAQSLAYVRDRDSLPNGDLDRTHRQQAALDYVIWRMENGGFLSDLGQLTGLLGTAKRYLITDPGWNLLDFSTDMKALTGKNLQFYTAPIASYATIEGQSANVIDIPTIQAVIKEKFTAPAPGAKTAASGAASGASAAASGKARATTAPAAARASGTATRAGTSASPSRGAASPSGESATATGSASPSPGGDNGAVGGAVRVGADARYGVPCIY